MPIKPPKAHRSWKPDRKQFEGREYINDRYHTTRWRKLRLHVLIHEPLCRECAKNGRVTAANVIDHITPVSTGKDEAERDILHWDNNNLQPLCDSCHNSKSGKEKVKH